MEQFLQFFIYIPLVGFLISAVQNKRHEKTLSAIAIATAGLQLVYLAWFLYQWALVDFKILDIKQFTILKTPQFDFYVDYYFDITAAVFLTVGTILKFLVSVFSKFYIHREEGFKRYFNNIQLFFFGYTLVVVAGNFETLFVGWEMVGITSFLLISFYRDRYLPVKNAMKVVSMYRLGDILLILAMWLCHHLWHENVSFYQMHETKAYLVENEHHIVLATVIGCMIFLSASIKSAMFPFSSWVSRAMEGPSSSSAIFYGSLSINLGVFLLLRTFPFWEHLNVVRVLIGVSGIITSLICNSIAKAQPTAKTQIAYASITQIGLIFVEIAFGFHTLALVHFAGNAFLRAYQILVSPSVLSYLIHHQLFKVPILKNIVSNKWVNSLYMLSIKEFDMDITHYRYLWKPFKVVGTFAAKIDKPFVRVLFLLLFILGIYVDINEEKMNEVLIDTLVTIFSFLSLLLILRSFTERASGKKAWKRVVGSHLFIILSISLDNHIPIKYLLMYSGGIFFFGLLGYYALYRLSKLEDDISLDQYHGNGYEHPKIAIMFLIACLGLIGFPISPLYIGIDLMLTYIESHQYFLIIVIALSLLFIELSLLRIYIRLFCGQHKKTYHPIAFKSS